MLKQFMLEKNIAISIITEPRSIPNATNWAGSMDGRAAIYWNPKLVNGKGRTEFRSEACVAIGFTDLVIASAYISPNATREEFLMFLDELDEMLNKLAGRSIILGGDFNSRSVLWGSRRTDGRGALVEEWAAQNDLRLVNTGNEPTCVRDQGESWVDLTWSTPDLIAKMSNWRVLPEETLSDHMYLYMEVGSLKPRPQSKPRIGWRWDKADAEIFRSSLILQCATKEVREADSANKIAELIDTAIKWSCDAAAPRRGPPPTRKACHWWSEEIAELRRNALSTRRRWQRERRRRCRTISEEEMMGLANNLSCGKTVT